MANGSHGDLVAGDWASRAVAACGDDSGRSTTDGPEADPSPREPEVPAPSVPEDCLSIRGMRYCEILVSLEGDDGPTP